MPITIGFSNINYILCFGARMLHSHYICDRTYTCTYMFTHTLHIYYTRYITRIYTYIIYLFIIYYFLFLFFHSSFLITLSIYIIFIDTYTSTVTPVNIYIYIYYIPLMGFIYVPQYVIFNHILYFNVGQILLVIIIYYIETYVQYCIHQKCMHTIWLHIMHYHAWFIT